MKGRIIIAVCLCMSLLSACNTKPGNDPVDDLFKGLTDTGSKATSPDSKARNYMYVIMQAIQLHMVDIERFAGKTCNLKVNLDSSGKVTNITAFEGDPLLCEAGINGIKAADIPAPPDEEVYQAFKTFIIELKPL
ncbi:protein TolA [Gibbsiella quercinecans]|uniref:cell envelope integrity protein TolA n=1 Tax=Gibbsiella quercinecans TaxID=929813 RepID=UPI000F139419|nr:cell envelope integrity protein TolA [Gibbsiella quercinecans]RLM07633.1 protein TolA [Gibbsiella quercinecans]